MPLNDPYSAGTISVANSAVTVTSTGALFTPNAIAGDFLLAGGAIAVIASCTDATLTLALPWQGPTLNGVAYCIVRSSVYRYQTAETQALMRRITQLFGTTMIPIEVTGAEPDPALGEEGQLALKFADNSFRVWRRTGGAWVYTGVLGSAITSGFYSATKSYVVGDIAVLGSVAYRCIQPNTNLFPPSHPEAWQVFLAAGGILDISFDDDTFFTNDLVRRRVFSGDGAFTFPAGLATSRGIALGAPATSNQVFSIRKNGTEVFTVTFAIGQTVSAFNCPAPVTYTAGDVMEIIKTGARDPSFADVSVTLIAYRSA